MFGDLLSLGEHRVAGVRTRCFSDRARQTSKLDESLTAVLTVGVLVAGFADLMVSLRRRTLRFTMNLVGWLPTLRVQTAAKLRAVSCSSTSTEQGKHVEFSPRSRAFRAAGPEQLNTF